MKSKKTSQQCLVRVFVRHWQMFDFFTNSKKFATKQSLAYRSHHTSKLLVFKKCTIDHIRASKPSARTLN